MESKNNIEKNLERSVGNTVKKGFKILFYILFGIAVVFLIGYILMRLWNWLMPDLFGLPEIDYWKAMGILLLAKIIFGFGGGGGHSKKEKGKRKPFFGNTCKDGRRDFSEWKYYDDFWKEEGEQAYKNYVERIQTDDKS